MSDTTYDPNWEQLRSLAASWGLDLAPAQIDQLRLYAQELRQWNERVNLTAITSEPDIVVRHFLDSLRCAASWGDSPRSLADIGTGAGFPGLPLKIAVPALRLTLIESVEKKAAFLRYMVAALGLGDVTVLVARAEAVGQQRAHREQYDVVTARAVAELRVLAEYGLPLCRPGGRMLAPKGATIAPEIDSARAPIGMLGGRLLAVEEVQLPGVEPRTLVVIEKKSRTPAIYPRAIGTPAKKPL